MSAPQTPAVLDNTKPLPRLGGVPRVRGNSPLGALGELMRDQFGALRRWQREYGGVFEIQIGPTSFVVAADANAASEMLIEHGSVFTREGPLYAAMEPLFGDNSMLSSEGPVWRSRRQAAQPQLRQRAVAAMADRVHGSLEQVLQELTPGACDVYRFSGRISMSVALSVVFGHSVVRQQFEELGAAVDYAVGRIALGWVASRLPRWVPMPGGRRLRRELAVIDDMLRSLVQTRVQSGEFGDDLFGMLLHMQDPDSGSGLSIADIRNESVALMVAGYETTANAIAWSLHELARDRSLLERVRAEADAHLDSGSPLANPKALACTRRVFMESMRMYPSGIWLPRNAAVKGELCGYPIAAGTPVLCSPYLVHHDPHAWTDPERFDPERFKEGSDQPRARHAYMPFGLGQHMCIGQHLAMLEGTLALARLVQRWDLAPIPGREPVMKISTTMSTKDGIWLQLSPRE
ncbi:putative cytochrome P450 hydroxylase [Enhygromyxa salina]|uniref:Putative cytochrome P450 hydroxylase n=1 Tax=Enhygromyxa salina TaxID=215803 RepID=A0A0C2D6V8_9BACT|nr:cytochrome P450 [Enhygromyxa salina]KIG17385.1 putative cytochrome P450 hydroxylase [Enhygromyxa salina]